MSVVVLGALFALLAAGVPVGAAVTPQDGDWTGTTSQSQPMSFVVKAGGTIFDDLKLKMTFSSFLCTRWVEVTVESPGDITAGQFSGGGGGGGSFGLGWTFSFTGTFDTATSAHGTYSCSPSVSQVGCSDRSGTWTATLSGSPPPTTPTCLGVAATWVGSAGVDTYTGTTGADVIVGLGG